MHPTRRTRRGAGCRSRCAGGCGRLRRALRTWFFAPKERQFVAPKERRNVATGEARASRAQPVGRGPVLDSAPAGRRNALAHERARLHERRARLDLRPCRGGMRTERATLSTGSARPRAALLHPWLHPDAPLGRSETPSARIGHSTGSATAHHGFRKAQSGLARPVATPRRPDGAFGVAERSDRAFHGLRNGSPRVPQGPKRPCSTRGYTPTPRWGVQKCRALGSDSPPVPRRPSFMTRVKPALRRRNPWEGVRFLTPPRRGGGMLLHMNGRACMNDALALTSAPAGAGRERNGPRSPRVPQGPERPCSTRGYTPTPRWGVQKRRALGSGIPRVPQGLKSMARSI
jgi:hypothetical protein